MPNGVNQRAPLSGTKKGDAVDGEDGFLQQHNRLTLRTAYSPDGAAVTTDAANSGLGFGSEAIWPLRGNTVSRKS